MRHWIIGAVLLCSGCPDDEEDFGHLGRAWPVSDQGITPTSIAGNFVASDDDQVCYELDKLLGWGITEEMKGFKIDPPASTTTSAIAIIVEQPTLGFVASEGHEPLGIIVKGADAFNVYAYDGTGVTEDAHLRSPYKNDKIPAISHYNVCTRLALPYVPGEQGCTPGYWRNHTDRWSGVSPGDDFDTVFRTNAFDGSVALGVAIDLPGGGTHALARHATAALLNAYGGVPNPGDGGTVAYPVSPGRVIAMVRAAVASGDSGAIEATKTTLDAYNNLGCPLHGTPAI